MNRALTGVLAAVLSLAPSAARAAFVSADGSSLGILRIGILSVADASVVTVSVPTTGVVILPLPDGATEVRFGEGDELVELDKRTAPRSFAVQRPAMCDPSYVCEVPRKAVEPPEPAQAQPLETASRGPSHRGAPTAPAASDGSEASGCLGWPALPPSAPALQRPGIVPLRPRSFVLVPRDALETTLAGLGRPLAPGRLERLPRASTYAIVESDRQPSFVRFRINGSFVWPIASAKDGGPSEALLFVANAVSARDAVRLFPRELLVAEPPRLYLAPSPQPPLPMLAAVLAEQLALAGKPVQLERVAKIEASKKPDARLGALGASGLPLSATELTLFRYRARNLASYSVVAVPDHALPHPTEPATAFVHVEETPENPKCPGLRGACYMPAKSSSEASRQGSWQARWPQQASQGSLAGPLVVEAPFGLATPHLREPSPTFPASAAPPAPTAIVGGLADAPQGPEVSRRTIAAVPAGRSPSAHGCTCRSSASSHEPSEGGQGPAGAFLLVIAALVRRRALRCTHDARASG